MSELKAGREASSRVGSGVEIENKSEVEIGIVVGSELEVDTKLMIKIKNRFYGRKAMLDATAKIPSGILQGNGIQLGDFDQCMSSKARVQLDTGTVVKVQGKYCLAYLDIKAEHPELEVPVYLAQAKNLIKSRIDDPGHFVPRFSTLSWGVCLPAACGPQDAEVVIKDSLKHYQHTTGLVVRVKVNENDCHVDSVNDWDSWLELPTVLTLAFYGIILLLVTIATLQDFLSRRKSADSGENEKPDNGQDDSKNGGANKTAGEGPKKHNGGILSVFSLYQTLQKLVAPVANEDIGCIHGLRALSTVALLAAHKFIPVAVMPYNNRLKITETVSAPWWSVFRAGWMYTDCFLLLSGTLSARRLAEDNDSASRRFFNRYLRLTPAHLAVILFYAYVWDKISEGPLWGSLVTRNAELCQESWWWNLLYVHNYFNFEDMCSKSEELDFTKSIPELPDAAPDTSVYPDPEQPQQGTSKIKVNHILV
ncbi:Nose resistant to fluoxetine protein 6 [Eumeta japonica]|uniref:Nose resistant to fluoxetine protein 6 n=1 Tax=Eumeta variegata TaxID=151549 RepID=A0A4C1WCR9_EUMVA|nr:Nose resistant to fluoxetine protein 6 [Eumeta japonica]